MKKGDLVRARRFIGVILEKREFMKPNGLVWKTSYKVCWTAGDITMETAESLDGKVENESR